MIAMELVGVISLLLALYNGTGHRWASMTSNLLVALGMALSLLAQRRLNKQRPRRDRPSRGGQSEAFGKPPVQRPPSIAARRPAAATVLVEIRLTAQAVRTLDQLVENTGQPTRTRLLHAALAHHFQGQPTTNDGQA